MGFGGAVFGGFPGGSFGRFLGPRGGRITPGRNDYKRFRSNEQPKGAAESAVAFSKKILGNSLEDPPGGTPQGFLGPPRGVRE